MEAHASLNTLDYLVLGTIILSGVLAIFSGFVREIYSLFNWAASAFIGAHYYRFAEPIVGKYITNKTTVTDVSIFAVFCISFILLGIIGSFVTGIVRGKALTAIDRSLGFVFGLVRGVFLVCLVYLVVTMVLWPDIDKPPVEQQEAGLQVMPGEQPKTVENKKITYSAPHWIMDARTRPLLAHGAAALKEFIPEKALEKTAQEYLDKKDGFAHQIDSGIVKAKDEALQKAGEVGQ